MIEVKNLVFEYPGVRALDDVSLRIKPGDITALVGPNGAGKTTLMRCMAALETPLSGTVTLDDIDIINKPRLCHQKMGYLADFFGLYSALTLRQCLLYFARAQLIPADQQEAAVILAAKRLDIEDRLEHKAGSLSRGLGQRLAIAQAIIHQPEIAILDEPASGLDPEARHSLSRLFLDLKKQGMTLIISSHILSELEEYTDHMLIVRDGKIISQSDIAQKIETRTTIKVTTHFLHAKLAEILGSHAGIEELQVTAKVAVFKFDGDSQKRHELIKDLIGQEISVCEFIEEKSNMQETYLQMIAESSAEASVK